jgi:hypothetical protein
MRELTVECDYDPCNCSIGASVDSDEVFCSDVCRNSSEESLEATSCSCGHPPCDEP